MKKLLFFCWISFPTFAQNYADAITKFRDEYQAEFLNGGNSPLKKEELTFLRFYAPNEKYRVRADFKKASENKTFQMLTSSGSMREYQLFGELFFEIDGKFCNLNIYRMMGSTNPEYADYLFLPFKDLTNGKESYGGGRYIDLRTTDIREDKVLILINVIIPIVPLNRDTVVLFHPEAIT